MLTVATMWSWPTVMPRRNSSSDVSPGLAWRRASTVDRRQVEVHLLPAGRKKLARLAVQHTDELTELAEAVRLASRISG